MTVQLPTLPLTLIAVEFHSRPLSGDQADRYIRILAAGPFIHERWGERGTPGQTLTRQLGSPRAAADNINHEVNELRQGRAYDLMFHIRTPLLGPRGHAIPDPHDIEALEEQFCSAWVHHITDSLAPVSPGDPMHWVALYGARAEESKNLAVATTLAHLRTRPYTLHTRQDLIVGQLARLPALPLGPGPDRDELDSYVRRTSTHMLAPVSHDTPTRTAELVAFLLDGRVIENLRRSERHHLVRCATRLAHLSKDTTAPLPTR